MHEINLTAEELTAALLNLEAGRNVCILDSCGVNHLGSHLLIAGFDPVERIELSNVDPERTLEIFDAKLSRQNLACIFTISYDFGLKLEKLTPRVKECTSTDEPDLFMAFFDCLIVHDYNSKITCISGREDKFSAIEEILFKALRSNPKRANCQQPSKVISVTSNFSRQNYLEAIEAIKEYIRRGDTYQTNLTQQMRAILPDNLPPQEVFRRLRTNHPAPFAAFLKRKDDFIVSVSPERLIKVQASVVSVAPIKGTRPRGANEADDRRLKNELINSCKDRAENVMIVDLLRNDIGRICEFGSVRVEKLCALETHPTLFHLVSTITGKMREDLRYSDIIKAVFPCGSITGAPKIRTMQIIDEIETAPRGLSMGAIGYCVNHSQFKIPASFELNVAIRTMKIKNQEAIFNVGGGIVIDSVPADEYEESIIKAQALLSAIGGRLTD